MIVDKNSYINIKNEIQQYAKTLCTSEELESFSNHINSKLNDFKPTLIIYGAYNAGKSTLLNALFGQDELAKTGDAPETKEVCEYPFNGYTIYDTPGLNARGEDDIITTEHLTKSEVVLFVISNNGSLEEEFIYNKISEVVQANKPIIIVLNNKTGIDLNSREAIELIDKVSINLRKVGDRKRIERIESKVDVCMVNAKSALKSKLENKKIMLAKSNIKVLEEMIDHCLNNSGEKEVINALNSYIIKFIEVLIAKVDQNIDNKEVQKVEELITYLLKFRQNSEFKLKNIINKNILEINKSLYSMFLDNTTSESSLNSYIETSIEGIDNQLSEVIISINNTLSTKIDDFSKEFEKLHVSTIKLDLKNDEDDKEEDSNAISNEIKSKLKDVISNKEITKKAAEKILTLTKKYLPTVMKGKGPVWIGKVAEKVGPVISIALDAYKMYDAYNEYEKIKEQERQKHLNAKNRAQTVSNDIKTTLYFGIDEIINEIFNDLIIGYRNTSSKITTENNDYSELKNKFSTILTSL